MTRAFSLDRSRKGTSLVPSSPGTLWSLFCPHSITQILFYHRMLLGLLWCHKILPPSHPRPLSLGQEESIIPSSLITPTVARRTPHQNTFSLLRDPRGNTGGGETGEEREEGGWQRGSPSLPEGCEHFPAYFGKATQTQHHSRKLHPRNCRGPNRPRWSMAPTPPEIILRKEHVWSGKKERPCLRPAPTTTHTHVPFPSLHLEQRVKPTQTQKCE